MKSAGSCHEMSRLLVRSGLGLLVLFGASGGYGRTLLSKEIGVKDPFVLADPVSQTYYLYGSDVSAGRKESTVAVYQSKDLETWSEPLVVLQIPKRYWASRSSLVSRPEVRLLGGRYYLFVTLADPTQSLPIRPDRPPLERRGVGVFVASSPLGPFQPWSAESLTPEGWQCGDSCLWFEDGQPWLIFVHSWQQEISAEVRAVRLTNDLRSSMGATKLLFRATSAPWAENLRKHGFGFEGYMAAAPWIYRGDDGSLRMLWTSRSSNGFSVGEARAPSGKIEGPWTQPPTPLFSGSGGRWMCFQTFENKTKFASHGPAEHPRLILENVAETKGGILPAGSAGTGFQIDRANDHRNVLTGWEIPTESYSDQPQLVRNRDGSWTCVVTTSQSSESAETQHVIASRSTDKGKTWSRPAVPVERSGPPESSWGNLLIAPTGRLYVFYNYNYDNFRPFLDPRIRSSTSAALMGQLMFKYSDDGGVSWSLERFEVPFRGLTIDEKNLYEGKRRYFWSVSKPLVVGDRIYLGLGRMSDVTAQRSEISIVRSGAITNWNNPEAFTWESWPSGNVGIQAPAGGKNAEEPVLTQLPDGGLAMVFRTTDGFVGSAYSSDLGMTWSPAEYAHHADGSPLKNPRANCPVFKLEGGYLLWFENHGGRDFSGRNLAWLAPGWSDGGKLIWGQPEPVLYDPDESKGLSYPDIIEENGKTWITETNKVTARIHQLDDGLLAAMRDQRTNRTVARTGLALELTGDDKRLKERATVAVPSLAQPNYSGGMAFELYFRLSSPAAGQILLDTRAPNGSSGVWIETGDNTLVFRGSDGPSAVTWAVDREAFSPGRWQHVVFIVDQLAGVLSVVVDGRLQDGGQARAQGWLRLPRNLGDLRGDGKVRVAPNMTGEVGLVRIYSRYLFTSEALANWRACTASDNPRTVPAK